MAKYSMQMYSHFINEKNYASIEKIETRNKYKFLSLFILVFTILSCTIISFSGYDFTKPSKIVFFSLAIAMSLFALGCIIYLYIVDSKFTVFKRKHYITLLYFPYFLLDICCFVSTNFTMIQKTHIDGEVYLGNNMIYFWLLYLPLFILLFVLSHFMFMKCFSKYTNYRIQYRDLNKSEFVAEYYADENELAQDQKIEPVKVSSVMEEKSLDKISNKTILHRFKTFINIIAVFSFIGCAIVGWFAIENLSIYTVISICVLASLFNIISIVFFILLYFLNCKYHVFTKKMYVIICYLPYVIFDVYCIACSVVNTLYLTIGGIDHLAIVLTRFFSIILSWIVFIYSIISSFTYESYFSKKIEEKGSDKLEE